MKKDEIKSFYDQVYQNYTTSIQNDDVFLDYERNRVLNKIYTDVTNKKILDLGAGAGLVSNFFKKKGYEVYAIEWTNAGVARLIERGIKAEQKDIEDLPYSYDNNYFDEVFWGDNIEHLFFPEKVTKEIYRILKPGGRLVLSTPNHGWIINRLYYFILGVPRRTEGHKTNIWEWQHIRYFNKQEMYKFLQHCGFTKKFIFHGAERRQPFDFLSRYFPEIMGSIMIVEVYK